MKEQEREFAKNSGKTAAAGRAKCRLAAAVFSAANPRASFSRPNAFSSRHYSACFDNAPRPKNAKNFSRPIDKCRKTVYTISCLRYLGVAQFGSVLEWGSRGRKFESSHPDQQKAEERENLVPRLFCAILAGRICAIPIAAAYPLLRPPTPARRGAKAFRERRDRKTAP